MPRLFIASFLSLVAVHVFLLVDAHCQPVQGDTMTVRPFPLDESDMPAGATKIIEVLDFKNADLSDVVRAIATKYGLNIFIEDGINERITIHLVQVPVYRSLNFIARKYNLAIERRGNIFELRRPPVAATEPLAISYTNDLLSLNLKNAPLQDVAEEISRKSGHNVVLSQGVQGTVSGFLQNLPFDQALRTLMSINGLAIRENEGVFIIEKNHHEPGENGAARNGKNFWVSIKDSLVNLDVTQANIIDVLREIFLQMGQDVVLYDEVKGEITARCTGISLENALAYLLKGTEFSFCEENGIYMIGDRNLQGIMDTKLIRLNHLRVDQVIELLPENIKRATSLKVIKEHNGLVVMGTQESINEVVRFIREIDRPIPQVLIEAIVVDFNRQDVGEFGIKAGIGGTVDTTGSIFNSLYPMIDVGVTGAQINNILDGYFGLSRIAKLPDDFYLQIKALESEGKVNVRSRPQIATLSGHTASISIGTTQYYILKTETPISGTNQVVLQESERFETIKAEMVLRVTPWVMANGDIITEIHPEFSTPKNGLSSTVPPTIDHRVLDSTVKLRDGETIILGGMIQEFDSESISKFPILGDIPILGKLFQNRSYNKSSSELMIYLTPHVYFVGDEFSTLQGTLR